MQSPASDLESQKEPPENPDIFLEGLPNGLDTDANIQSTHPRFKGGRDAGHRLPIEFRTLSIHVDTRATIGGDKDKPRAAAVKELVSLDWHKISTEEALRRLGVSPVTGLDTTQAQRRLKTGGKNVISPPKNNYFRKVLEWVLGGFGSLLLVASIVCFIAWKPLGKPKPEVSNLALAVVLLLVLVIQAFFNAWQDFSTSRVMSSIKGMLPSDVMALRNAVQEKIPASELVTGDLVYISMGEKVPADLRLIEVSIDLQFDRSILTGESEAVSGRVDMTEENFLETKNVALQGTHCVNGSGLGVVIQTGDRTVFGLIAKLSSVETKGLTTLQRELFRFVGIIAGMATIVAAIIVILWAAWLRRSFPSYINVSNLLIDVVSVMVAFIPEGLPVAVTLSLAKVASRLGKHKVLCKSLSIVETLGSVNVLCSDKTGTLTQNIMHVENVAVLDVVFDSKDYPSTVSSSSSDVAANLSQIVAAASICNTAVFDAGTGSTDEKKERVIVGNATDVAIFKFADSVASVDETRRRWEEVFRMNFNSKTKFMLILSKLAPSVSLDDGLVAPLAPWDEFTPTSFLLTSKGAPEILLPRCSFVLDPEGGAPIPINTSICEKICAIQERWAGNGQRVLLLARRIIKGECLTHVDPHSEEFSALIEEYHRDLVIVGLVGLIDPLKPDIKDTVKICRRAGIRFFIITGDHPTTAVSIAGQAGIITDTSTVHHASDLVAPLDSKMLSYDPDLDDRRLKGIVVTGSELQTLKPAQVEQLCQYEEIVFARTTPEQKLRIVNDFKSRGNVVAVTGDGVNDAPSLKAADCGIAMGQGSDVAREAADLVLLGDFSSIVIAIEFGRLVFDNLKKTVLYLLPAGSFSELMPILFNILFGLPQMLSNIQMIVICVATDVLPALSMCLEKPETGLLQRKPRNVKKDRLVNWKLLLQAYGFLGVLETLCAMSMSFWYLKRHGVPFSALFLGFGNWPGLTDELLFTAQSVYFFTLVIMQWGNLFATRGRRLSIFQHTPASNWYVFPAADMALVLAIFFSYVPWFQKVFQTRPIPVEFFFIPITFGLGLLFLDEMRKYLVRAYPGSFIDRMAW